MAAMIVRAAAMTIMTEGLSVADHIVRAVAPRTNQKVSIKKYSLKKSGTL